MASPTENNTSNNDWLCTQTRGDHIEFEWKIEKFHLLPQKNREWLYSPVFPMNSTEQWKVKIYPKGDAEEHAEWISVYLRPSTNKSIGIKIKYEFTIFQLNKVLEISEATHRFEKLGYGWGSPKFVKRSKLLVQDDPTDTITVRCRIDILGTYITSSSDKKSWDMGVLFEARKNRLTEDYQSFYENSASVDFTVISGDMKFPTHKTILSSRSPVLAAMFQHKEVEENVKNELKIENIEPDVVKRLLEFIYTDGVSEIGEFADRLLAAAEQYALEGLKNLCEETLYKTLNEDNAAKLLALADLHNAYQLKKYVLQFVVDHPKKVVKSEAFESTDLSKELSKEIIRALTLAESEDDSD